MCRPIHAPLVVACVALTSSAGALRAEPRRVQLYNTHTRERLHVGRYLPSPRALDRFLRSRRARRYTLMDPRLVRAVVEAARRHRCSQVQIVSAFRPRVLNEAMRRAGRRVARNSRHISGQALDVRLVGVATSKLCRYFDQHHRGGVGCYAGARFVHIDSGPRRRWGFAARARR